MKFRNMNNYGYMFVIPFFVLFFIFSLYPILYTLFLSLTQYDGMGPKKFVGLDNYARLVVDPFFWRSLYNTWRVWVVNFIPQIGVSLLLAALFTYNRVKGQGFFRAFFYLPNLVTAASVALLFNVMLDWQYGLVNQFLILIKVLKEPIDWLRSPEASRNWVAFIGWWMWYGQTTIMLMAGMSAIPTTFYEAAIADGASKPKIFTHITLPLLKPTLLYIFVTSLIGGMQIFDIPMVMTAGGPDHALEMMVILLYNQAFRYNNFGYGSAIAYGIFLIIAIFSFILYFAMRQTDKD